MPRKSLYNYNEEMSLFNEIGYWSHCMHVTEITIYHTRLMTYLETHNSFSHKFQYGACSGSALIMIHTML